MAVGKARTWTTVRLAIPWSQKTVPHVPEKNGETRHRGQVRDDDAYRECCRQATPGLGHQRVNRPDEIGVAGEEGDAMTLSVVVPVFNEVEILPALHERLTSTMQRAGVTCETVLVDDGSRDGS
jgi:hypothetical protein